MPSSSGDANRAGLNQAGNKLKAMVAKNSATSSGFQLVSKNGKPLKNLSSPVSPSFRQIVKNPPSLNVSNISSSAFDYNNISLLTDKSSESTVMDINDNANDHTNEFDIDSSSPTDNSVAGLSSTKHDNTSNNNKYVNILQKSFSSDYIGPVIVLIESLIENTNLGN
ncbi:uncharacterized protein LOC132945223 [Metopolophium dirhodum]|uniref:uncharacterized protein LOC132945223 n=1 Tax=Metopolophium dirhodum TaxID=44670 RepID=UPI0029901F85|nr:uncharacterized protein LOC132945223 [Metopolophium dirhodum]